VSAIAWLAIPVIVTLLAAIIVPAAARRRGRELPAADRAERIRRALGQPDGRGRRGSRG
jgi:cytochrome c-type biogenesis protein CcmH/NrfF